MTTAIADAMKSLKFKRCIGVEWLNTENTEHNKDTRTLRETVMPLLLRRPLRHSVACCAFERLVN